MLTSSLEWIQSGTSKAAAFNVHEFLGQQMNVILQKLVKAIPADKATWLHKLAIRWAFFNERRPCGGSHSKLAVRLV